MAITSRITRNFQVTIPAEVRKQLSLKEGDILAFGVKQGKILAIPVRIESTEEFIPSQEWAKKEKLADQNLKNRKIVGPFNDIEDAFSALEGPEI